MSLDTLFFWLDLELAAAILVTLLLLAAEVGFRLGRGRAAGADEAIRSQLTVLEGSALAVLGLLLAFTLNMAVTRFESRKQVVVHEANAIGTAYLRARLLPEPDRGEVQAALRRYVDSWLEFHDAGPDIGRTEAAMKRMDQLQEQLWSRTAALARQNPDSLPLSLMLQSLNETFDRYAELIAAVRNRVPGSVLLLLVLVSAASLWIVGRNCGMAGSRNFLIMCLFCCMLTGIIVVILDLDRPRRGLVQLSAQSMIALRASMDEPTP